MAQISSRWLKDNKKLTNRDRENIAASLIQITWKKHRQLIEQDIRDYKNKISQEMLKSKICFICKKNKVFIYAKIAKIIIIVMNALEFIIPKEIKEIIHS